MGENSKIEWTHHTFNPWRGCTKVAEGCKFCYADALSKRNPNTLGVWGPDGTRVMAAEKTWREPIKWNRDAEAASERRRVFCASLADVFEDWDGPIVDSRGETIIDHDQSTIKMPQARQMLFDLIDATPWLDWLLLTKRPENIRRMWPRNTDKRTAELWGRRMGIPGGGDAAFARPNIWLLTSIATQADADRNIPELLKCRDLVPVLGLSAEPLVGPVDLSRFMDDASECEYCGPAPATVDIFDGRYHEAHCQKCHEEDPNAFCTVTGCDPLIDWVIVGGESGHHARPFTLGWGKDIVRQCGAAGVPVFVKQVGANPVNREGQRCPHIKDKKGGDWNEWPEDLRVREFPATPTPVPKS